MSESTTPPLGRFGEMLNIDSTEGQFECRVSAGVRTCSTSAAATA